MTVCNNKTYSRNNNTYYKGETKNFDLKSFIAADFQSFANDKISKEKTSSDDLRWHIDSKVLNTIFEQITGSNRNDSNKLSALWEIN